MFRSLHELCDSLLASHGGGDPAAAERALRLAAAVMLVEVMRADARFDPREQEAVRAALRETFALTDEEAESLAEVAATTANQATDLYAFTSRIDQCFDEAGKLRMIEQMWHVAYADGHLSEDERHVIWRIADLLHVPQGGYVRARILAQQAAGAA